LLELQAIEQAAAESYLIPFRAEHSQMNWLDALRERGMQAKRLADPVSMPAEPRQPKHEIKPVVVQTRSPQFSGDLGGCEIGYYSVSDGVLTMRDEKGAPLGKDHQLAPNDDPHRIAGRLTLAVWNNANRASDFTRPLYYPRRALA
jgi:hypothetical protein